MMISLYFWVFSSQKKSTKLGQNSRRILTLESAINRSHDVYVENDDGTFMLEKNHDLPNKGFKNIAAKI